jgi:hypothetical protein
MQLPICLGSGLTANRENQFNASGLYFAFDCSGSSCLRFVMRTFAGRHSHLAM